MAEEQKSRAVIVGKLLLLVGLPLATIAGIFGTGVHYGFEYRADILRLERDLLGMDVQVPGSGKLDAMLAKADASMGGELSAPAPTGAPAATGSPAPAPTGAPAATGSPAPAPSGAPASTGALAPTGVPAPSGAPAPTGAPATTGSSTATGAPTPAPTPAPETSSVDMSYPLAVTPELPDDLRAAYDRVRVLKVKVLVDRAYIAEHADWLSSVNGLINAVSKNYGSLFGMHLQLWGVVEWDVPAQGLDVEQLHADVKTRAREGADLLLAITGRELDETRRSGWSETPEKQTPRNTAFAVVYFEDERPDRLMRAVMHELAHCFGAHDVTEPASDAWQRGSIMSYANVASDAIPWFDAENLRRVLERKHKDIETDAPAKPAPTHKEGE